MTYYFQGFLIRCALGSENSAQKELQNRFEQWQQWKHYNKRQPSKITSWIRTHYSVCVSSGIVVKTQLLKCLSFVMVDYISLQSYLGYVVSALSLTRVKDKIIFNILASIITLHKIIHSLDVAYRFHTKTSLFKDLGIVVNDFKHYPRQKIRTTNNWDKHIGYVFLFLLSQ